MLAVDRPYMMVTRRDYFGNKLQDYAVIQEIGVMSTPKPCLWRALNPVNVLAGAGINLFQFR
ncbi:MAG: hypothetical protein Q8O57_08610, partial [Kiritimatiellota bacterium]|nr:hypothetical protein [Kiritimatiellota bacterium]